jgi:ABC-type glycerol-3-phosphate transport system substrate-binding protein
MNQFDPGSYPNQTQPSFQAQNPNYAKAYAARGSDGMALPPKRGDDSNDYLPPTPKKVSFLVYLIAGLVLLGLLLGGILYFISQNKTSTTVDKKLVGSCTTKTDIVWRLPDTSALTKNNLEGVLTAYKAKFKNAATIQIDNRTYDKVNYYSSLIEDIAKNQGPDIFAIRNDDVPVYSAFATTFSDTFFTSSELNRFKQEFVDLAVEESFTRNRAGAGDLVAIPLYVDTLQLYRNKQILDQNGFPQPAATWEDIVLQSKKLSKPKSSNFGFDQSAIALGTGFITNKKPNIVDNQDILPTLIAQYGGVIFDPTTNTIGFKFDTFNQNTESPFYRAVNFYTSFANNSKSNYSWDQYQENSIDEFIQGRLAYMVGYKELDEQITKRNNAAGKNEVLDFQVSQLPQVDSSKPKTLGRYFTNMMSISLSDTANNNKRACVEEFLNFLSKFEAQNAYAISSQMPSAHKKVIESQKEGDQKVKIFAEGALIAVNYYKPDVFAVESIWSELAQNINGGQSLTSAISKAAADYSSVISKAQQTRKF